MTEEGVQELTKVVLAVADEMIRLANKDPKENGNELFLAKVGALKLDSLRQFADYHPPIIVRPDAVNLKGTPHL